MSDVDNQKLSVRIVKADYYLAKPVSELNDPCYSGFRSLPVYHVPVIRIFGPTKEGLKACVHVHGVFPYIFIPNWNKEIGEKDLYHFASCLDKAINTSFAYSSSKTTHVYRITTVIGRPFYGYHKDEKSFLKIEFYNPAIVRRAADLLLNEAVLNTSFQPYEAHVPYILQFFIDNNLYGMSFITLSSYRMRQENSSDASEPILELTHSSPTGIIKQSYTSLEVDSHVSHIVNEFTNADDMPNNPGLAFIWQEERKRRRLQHKTSQITPNVSQIRSATLTTQSEQYYKRKLSEKLRRYKANEMKQRIIDAESNMENNSVLEEDVHSSCEELNTQSRSILQLLEKLVSADNDCVKKKECTSPDSSPSIIFSDDEMEPMPSNTSLICSQPVLKLPAEDDSILGTNFSDDDVDEDDHYLLSQSLVQVQPELPFSENISEEDDFQIIDQLDGTSGGNSPSRSKNKNKNTAKKQENKTIKSYNLRSCDKLPNAANLEENRKSITHKYESKISPRKVYPQLQIDTQKSPRSAARVSSEERSEISQASYPSPESFVTTFVPEKLGSPTTNAHSENRRSESKRPYPQLDVNIKTSPRTSSKNEQEGETNVKKGTRVMKKRKIDFDLSNDHSNLNMTLMTTRWKKQLQSRAKKGAESDRKSSRGQFAEVACSNLKNNIPILSLSKDCKDVPKLFSSVPITYTISNEIESQKFSLKVCLDNCGSVDGRELLQDFLTRRPVVKIQKLELRDSNSNQSLSDRQCTQGKNDDPVMNNCNADTSNSSENNQSLQRTKDEPFSQVDFLGENINKKLSKLGFFCDKNVFVPRWEKGRSIFSDNNSLLQQSSTFSRNNICTDTVTLDKYSGRSTNSDTKLFAVSPKVPNAKLSETVSVKKNHYNMGDYPVDKKEALDANRCNTDNGDDQFMVPDVQDVGVCSVQLKARLYDKSTKEFPLESDLFANPSVFEDEDLAKVKCNYSLNDEDFPHNFPKSDASCNVYSSADDDEFPESTASQLNLVHGSDLFENSENPKLYSSPMLPVSGRDASDSMFSQNSDEDEAFANIKLDNLTSQNNFIKKFSSPEINETSNTFISSSLRTCVDVATVMCDNVDVASDFPVSDLNLSSKMPSDSTEITTTLQPQFMFDNSIWDSITDPASDDDDPIRSFYSNKSVTSNEVTVLQCDEIQDEKLSPLDEVFISQNENEIMSFYDTESPISGSDAEVDTNSPNKKSMVVKRPSDDLGAGSSPSSSEKSVLHSTPQSLRKKKSPSPTYTPIIKKLMLKKIAKEEKGIRSRKSSRRFQSEPFLADIKEEEERRKEITEDVPMKLLINTSNEKSNVDKKPLDNSRSSYNNGSGEIDITLANTYGFRMNLENLQDVKAEVQHQFITVMSMEMFTTTRSYYNPDPEYDPVCALFYTVFVDDSDSPKLDSGVIIVTQDSYTLDFVRFKCKTIQVKNEEELFDVFIKLIRKWDPDIFVGYEVEMLSWGYLIQRGQVLGRNYDLELSRLKEIKSEIPKDKTIVDNIDYSDDLKLVGRIVLNIWRLMRHEIALQSYSFENIVFHILHQRVPLHSFSVLTEWWRNPLRRWIVIDYYLLRVESNILLLQQLDFIGRTSELARLFGIQFYEVLSRGSQFRVESMMLRLAKTRNFVAVSPSIKQRASMRAPESLPLIMEPDSKYYTDPVIVLDFQSLYPSIIIAYNYCFSTCLGRVENLVDHESFKFGCLQHTIPIDLLVDLEPYLNISPCGVAFVNKDVRTGVLPSMLQEILDTRLMVKKSMKENKDNKTLHRVLHARQLGLKLIANVTYGYTSANFSGRMPCIEVGDSVVSKGRETLERVIEMVSKNEKWGAKVIYGDTDSVFVLTPNRTKEEAFRIGAEIAEAATNDNPQPVKLKLEKVYYPCILQTKKRYVGYMYESPDQKQPVYDAKGIETVRRDGCPAVSKILEKSLKLLFDHKEISVIKQYVQRQFSKLISGRLSIQELTFAREYRGLNNYKPSACVPALQLARQAVLRDRRSEPRVKERVRYVLTAGPPGVPLIRSVRTPQQFLDSPGSIINAEYYITRVIIPALERCFSLLNVDVRRWYTELPKKLKFNLPVENDIKNKAYKKKTISHYFAVSKCIACENTAIASVCKECQKNPQRLALILGNMINSLQRKCSYVEKICRSCCARNGAIECSSLDCPVYFRYRQAIKDIEQVPYLEELQQLFLQR